MFVAERHEPLLPFPEIPDAVKLKHSIGQLALRPFGLYESDLSVDFSHTPRPFLVTQILECCTRDVRREKVDESFFWNLTIGKRIECLLNLVTAGEPPEIAFTFPCPNDACGQSLEIELGLEEISELQEQAYATERVSIQIENAQLSLRRPTGSDQLAWLKSRFAQEDAAVRGMLRTLLLEETKDAALDDGQVPGELVQTVGRAMEEHDPLVNFSLRARCPYCEQECPYEIDLEAFSLRRLRQAQLRLLASVHRLAAHYHWSEEQIFAVPYWRRAFYLSLIEKEKKQ